jgi:rubrerythrin
MKKTTLALLCGLGIVVPSAVATDKIFAATMTNLQAAFNGESNAHARYLAFAQKADDEGYAGAASLFRAAARAEEIHAANHETVIKKSGGVPDTKVEPPTVKSTRENLAAAIKGETYERDEMYPAFIRQAKSDGASEAVRTFSFALAAEAEHAKLYADTLGNLESLTASRVFYVCPICGFTSSNPNFDRCPTCATPKERFEQVS